MPFFSYSVLGRQGEIITGKLEAECEACCKTPPQIGCLLLEIKEIKSWLGAWWPQRK